MKFSIIVPIYNGEKYIDNCVQSALKQTYKDFELVLVDDGSTDRSGAMCDELSQKYPRKIKTIHHENKGQLFTRCRGIEVAEGDYCIFLDADDDLSPNCLEILGDTIEKHDNPDAVIYSFFYVKNGKTEKVHFPFADGAVYTNENKKSLYGRFFNTSALNMMWTKAVKRDIAQIDVNDLGELTKLRSAEDRYHSMYLLTKAQKIVCIDKALYYYNLVQGSVTRSFNVSALEKLNTRPLCKKEEEFLKAWGMDCEKYTQMLEASFLNQPMYIFLNFYNQTKGRKEKKNLLRYDWSSFAEPEYFERLDSNKYVSPAFKKMWKYSLKKSWFLLELFCVRNNIYKKYRDIKKKILK